MPQASSMSDTRGMLQAAPHQNINEANQNRNKKVSFVLPVGKANFLTQNFPEVKI
jgi:hypothetical protein